MEREDDPTVRREAEAAAREAAAIGGQGAEEDLDPAERPVAEAGEGESEGFEEAEELLVENAGHGEGVADPGGDALPEEADSGGVYGEADTAAPQDEADREAGR